MAARRHKFIDLDVAGRIMDPIELVNHPPGWFHTARTALEAGLAVWLVRQDGIDALFITNGIVPSKVAPPRFRPVRTAVAS